MIMRIALVAMGVLAWLWAAPLAAEQVIKRDEAVSRMAAALHEALRGQEDGFVADTPTLGHDVKLPDGAVSWQVELPGGTLQPGRQSLPVTVLVEGQAAQTLKVTVLIRQKLLLPALKEPLPKGRVVTGDDLQWLELVSDRILPDLVRDGTEIHGKETLRQVRPGVPLQRAWFSEPVAVKRGEKVRVIFKKSSLDIETTAVAVTQGRLGEEIQVMNPDSSRRYKVRITAPGEATIE